MHTPIESLTDLLAARTTIEDYGNISIVTIPGSSTLSEAVRSEVTYKARQLQAATPYHADALAAALREVTPPLDEEEENEDSRAREALARQELENNGCPPCYPPNLDVPLRYIPEEYQAIVGYWKSFPGTGDVPLCAQKSDWRRFRAFQLRARRGSQNTPFSKFEDQVRERRRRHGLDGLVRLMLKPEQQSQLDQWIEFQNYQLVRLERLEEKRDRAKQNLDELRKTAQNADAACSQRAARDADAVEQILETAERDLDRHKIFLQWIEQKRLAIDPGRSTPAGDGGGRGDGRPVEAASTRVRRGRRPKTSAVLGKVKFSKATPPKRHTQTQRPKAAELKPAAQDSDVIPRSRTPEAPKSSVEARHTQGETPLRQLRPQRVTKAKRTIDARVTPPAGTRPRHTGQTRPPDRARAMRRPATQRPQPAPEHVTTRSGRMSRPPARWLPG